MAYSSLHLCTTTYTVLLWLTLNALVWLVTAPESLEQHKWWFRSGMTRDDVILIKIFDSKKDGRARRAPHCAATTPDCFGPARRSLETRFFLFWEDDTSE